MATAPLDPELLKSILPTRQAYTDTSTVVSAVRLDKAGRLIVGSVGALRSTGTTVHPLWARRYVQKHFPQLGTVSIAHQWYGRIGMTKTHLPVMHMLAPNLICVEGYNGRGIAAGTMMGRCLAEMLTGATRPEDMPLPITQIERAPCRAVSSIYYEYGAQATHLWDAVTA